MARMDIPAPMLRCDAWTNSSTPAAAPIAPQAPVNNPASRAQLCWPPELLAGSFIARGPSPRWQLTRCRFAGADGSQSDPYPATAGQCRAAPALDTELVPTA